MGIGLGERSAPYGAFGLTPAKRVRRFEEGIQLMKALWTQTSTEYHSDMYHLEDAHIEPKPVQRPHLPIWLGGGHPNVLKRSVNMADGWMGAGASSNSFFKERVVEIRRLLEEAGRSTKDFTISKRIYISIDSNENRALEGLRQWFGAGYNNPGGASEFAIWGSPQKCADILEDVASVGVDHLLLNPVHAFEEQLEAVAEITGLK
jgi:alkanesulfonate monooxygenase SsuD/methylene tetrahydromethanopterin reductase-like flavin-dependent oxidoreductase (luciferase family)